MNVQQQIAAEVAARYGIPVQPDAVQLIPIGKRALHVEYLWRDGKLQAVETQQNAVRTAINARWRQHEHGKRLAKAKKAEQPRKEHPAIAEAKVRAAFIREMAAQGATMDLIAQHMGITENSARKYCDKYGIKAARRKSGCISKSDERYQRTMAFAGAGDKTIRQIADFLGISWPASQKYCKKRGIPFVITGPQNARHRPCGVEGAA